MLKQIILGTAGHIDHGKTSLIKAITGINTDRLKEEKLRGITIELGFASMDLPNGQHVGIVDVPGHEKFVKNMVAGATGIDIVVMVIAADEGVMPQTREHMEICTLLGIRYGLVALTKTDLVDEEWLELVQEDINDFTAKTFLKDAPIIPLSSSTGQGLPDFIKALEELSGKIPQEQLSTLFRLPVDRVFTMKGFGTVITGTLISGRVMVGETIMLYPSGNTSKVRGLQVHNHSVDKSEQGFRTAINFQGLDKSSVKRGDVVSKPNTLKNSYMLDVFLHFLKSNAKPLKNRTAIRFHTGTSEILGNVILLEEETLLPGNSTVAQLRLDTPTAVVKDDRFVIRSYSPVHTIGGGHIINPIPQKHKRFKASVIKGLKGIVDKKPEDVILYHLDDSGFKGIPFSDLRIMTNHTEKKLDAILQMLLSKKEIILSDKERKLYVHQHQVEILKNRISENLRNFHSANPLKNGMLKEELKSKFPSYMGSKLFTLIINQMIKESSIVNEGKIVRLTTHKVSLGLDQAKIKDRIIRIYLDKALQPPYFREISKSLDIDMEKARDVLLLLIDQGILIKTKDDLYFHEKSVNRLKEKLVAFLEIHGEITTPQFKDMTGSSRKYVIPLIEYFDTSNVTIRIGDIRKLRTR